jgi:hypothetical protein
VEEEATMETRDSLPPLTEIACGLTHVDTAVDVLTSLVVVAGDLNAGHDLRNLQAYVIEHVAEELRAAHDRMADAVQRLDVAPKAVA